MTMIKCPECRHHISSMANNCPECGAPIDPEWAKQEADRELKKLEDVPFAIKNATSEDLTSLSHPEEGDECSPDTREDDFGSSGDIPQTKPESRTKGGVIWYIFLIVLLALAIGGLYYYQYHIEKQREQHAYEMLKDCSNPDFFEDYIVRFPKSSHIEDVRTRLKVVMAQQSEWANLIQKGTREDLSQFVRLHPNSPYVKVAQTRIDSLDWAEAMQKHTLEAVAQYLASHPDGYFVDNAEQMRQTLDRARAEAAAAVRDSLARADSTHLAVQP